MNRYTYDLARPYTPTDRSEWLRMRLILWPEQDDVAHLVDMEAWLSRPDAAVLVVPRDNGGGLVEWGEWPHLAGFAEVGTRSVADSCETSPVAYLEGWFVDADMRLRGVGTALVRAAEEWARTKGYREIASDTQIENVRSQRAHEALGFIEVDRVAVYRKVL
jgi:aminoglycoside 6'-N-acetyltransferase I